MSRQCELTGVRPLIGNNVSHSKRRTKRRFLPNLVRATVYSEALGRSFRLRIATRALRHIDKSGGLDLFLLKADKQQLSPGVQRIKRDLVRVLDAK